MSSNNTGTGTAVQASGSANTAPGAAIRGPTSQAGASISIFGLILLSVTAVISLNNLPSEAEYGLSSVFYFVFAAIFFLIPVAMGAAELATGWPERGVFRWVGEAFKGRFGLMAMFLAFVEVCVFLPTTLTFAAVSIAYVNPDEHAAESLASNKFVIVAIVLIVYWIAAFVTLRGTRGFQTMAKWGGIIGVFLPMAILIGFGIAYNASDKTTSQMKLGWGELIPDFSSFSSIVLAASVFLMFAGMEMNAVHVKEVKNPKRNYPLAIFIAAFIVVAIFVSGTLIVAYVVPQKDINLTQAILTTYFDIFHWAGVPWLGSVVAVMLAIGVLVNVTTWVAALPPVCWPPPRPGTSRSLSSAPQARSTRHHLDDSVRACHRPDVHCGDSATVLPTRPTSPLPAWEERQWTHVAGRRRWLPLLADRIRFQLHPSRPDQGWQPPHVRPDPRGPSAGVLRSSEHHLPFPRAFLGRS